jgi:hypothetical protein
MAKKFQINSFRRIYIIVGSLTFITIFLYTGIKKLVDLNYIAYVIENYPFYQYLFASFLSSYTLAIMLSISEIALVLMFFFISLKLVLKLVISMLLIYSLNIFSLIIENTFFECGCGLFYLSSNPSLMLITDFILIIVAISLLQCISKNDNDTFIDKLRSESKSLKVNKSTS